MTGLFELLIGRWIDEAVASGRTDDAELLRRALASRADPEVHGAERETADDRLHEDHDPPWWWR